jgi:uncharacterized protein YbjT (DUF2867 family)
MSHDADDRKRRSTTKITLFGASGAIGKILTGLAVADGNDVNAYVRRRAALQQVDSHVSIIEGEPTDAAGTR